MSGEVIKVLDDLCSKLGIAIDWSSENIMPYLQEMIEKYIRYEWASTLFSLIFCIIAGAGIICFVIKSRKKKLFIEERRFGEEMTTTGVCIYIVCGFALVIAVVSILWDCNNLIKLATFPEQLILSELKDLM